MLSEINQLVRQREVNTKLSHLYVKFKKPNHPPTPPKKSRAHRYREQIGGNQR